MSTTQLPDPRFTIQGAEVLSSAVAPHVAFKLRLEEAGPWRVHSVLLGCQVFLEPVHRRYSDVERSRLRDIFGDAELWDRTLTPMLWTTTTVVVPAFSKRIQVDLPVACPFDFNVSVARYCAALEAGEIPVAFYFNGTIFYAGETGVEATRISREREADYRLPVRLWRQMREAYYPGSAWLCLRRDAFERLDAYRIVHGLPTFEQAVDAMTRVTP